MKRSSDATDGGRHTVARRRAAWLAAALLASIAVATGVLASRSGRWPRFGPAARRSDLLQAASSELKAGRPDAAAEILDRGDEGSQTPLEWMLRARIARARGRLDEALACLRKITDSSPAGPGAWLLAGQVEIERHRTRAAESAFRRSLKLEPRQVQPYRELIAVYTMQGRKAECDALFRALRRFARLDFILAYAWCQNHCGLLDPAEAVEKLRPCIAADPDDRWSRLALVRNSLMMGGREDAELAIAPLSDDDADARALRIAIAIGRGELDRAEGLARGGPDDNPRLNLARAELAARGDDPRHAVQLYRTVLRDDPTSYEAIHGLGLTLRRLNDPKAEEALEQAERLARLKRLIHESIQAENTAPKILLKLGALCEDLHLIDEARAWYSLMLEHDPADRTALDALDRLNRGPTP